MKTALPLICFFYVVHFRRGCRERCRGFGPPQGRLEITISMDKIEKITKESADGEPVGEAAMQMTAMGKHAVEVNLLGLLQFGPLARFYFGLGNDLFIAAHVRIGFAGALIYLLFDYPLPDIASVFPAEDTGT